MNDKLDNLLQQATKTKIDYSEVSVGNQVVFTHARNSQSPHKLHKINSITKSVVSLLIGIALDRKHLHSVHTPLSDYFPSLRDVEYPLTVEHLLTMTTGWDWPEMEDWGGRPMAMINSSDWLKYILSRPFKHNPGTRMIYNSGSSHLLSAILQKVTGMTTAEYAEKHLFKPLGIDEYRWYSDPKGIVIGGFGLELKAPDLHKLGKLMLGKGRAGTGTEVVSEAWIEQSVKPRFHTYDHIGSYGYHWWIMRPNGEEPAAPQPFFAMGYGGQYIFVVPERELVVTFASTLYKQTFLPYRLFKELLAE
ncbi:serine hydrolase domain-containing protein [Cohnella silvisoli]|uniref:Serine hydrolase n=1 Tax=Cohnella silvisoli TaxID=2873699 RepID=A0ABV1KYC4_9BACL|nr:serine hydrolase [Cohnella silvisoli]MCD9021782.1 beta-lactamase family protein [Cohnella silvisoli]